MFYVPSCAPVVAGDGRVRQKVQLHVVVEFLRRTRVKRLCQVLHLRHKVIHVLLHGGEIQREALCGVTPVGAIRGRRWCAPRLRVAAAPEPSCAKSPGRHQHQQQHWGKHCDRCHLIPAWTLPLQPEEWRFCEWIWIGGNDGYARLKVLCGLKALM